MEGSGRAADPKGAATGAPKAVTPGRPPAPDAEILRTLRLYENAYASRSIEALRRVQVLTPAEVQSLSAAFADALQYRLVVDTEDIQPSADGKRAIVNARMTRQISSRSGFKNYTDIPVFTMEKRGSTWMILSVTNVR